jgi:hypothetical protein
MAPLMQYPQGVILQHIRITRMERSVEVRITVLRVRNEVCSM